MKEKVFTTCIFCNVEFSVDKSKLLNRKPVTIGSSFIIDAKEVYFKVEVYHNEGDLCPKCGLKLIKDIVERLE
jgi:formamidopyrimidine-DNA glycosylase